VFEQLLDGRRKSMQPMAARLGVDHQGPAAVRHPCAFHAIRSGVRTRSLVAISGVNEFDYLVAEFARQLRLRPSLATHIRRQAETVLGSGDIWARFTSTHRAADLSLPLLVIHDTDDDVVDSGHARRIHAAYPQSRLILTSGLGHRRILGDPRIVTPVAAFLTDQSIPA
jgi:pimeloyl-ACP methyl ester carboxylesterase